MIDIIFTYIALSIFILGIIYKLYTWAKSPIPVPIGIYQDSTSAASAIKHILLDVIFFRPLLRFGGNFILWLGSWLFHIALFLTLIGHIKLFLHYPIVLPMIEIRPILKLFVSTILPASLIYLLLRRIVHRDLRYISTPADYFVLLLLLGIIISGIIMANSGINLVAVKYYILSILSFKPVKVDLPIIFWIHYTLVLILLIYFPFSKLMHLFGALVSPTKTSYHKTKAHTKKLEL